MQNRLSRTWKIAILLLANVFIIAVLIYGFEYYLRLTDPFLKLPFDSNYYLLHQEYYSDLEAPEERYTWGHLVENNSFGLREREFEVPKPPDVCRIMVLGDSLTWGAGLAVEERYTNLTDHYLHQAFPDRKFEVLNFGVSGGPTTVERDVLHDALLVDSPDLIVVGFVLNDPQPRQKAYRIEKEQFDEKYGDTLNSMSGTLIKIGLPQTAKMAREAFDNFIVRVGIIPPWEVGVDRTYDRNSEEWQDFTQALQDIKTMSDKLNLASPIFLMLTQDIFWDTPTDYQDQGQDKNLPIYVRWAHQAQRTADEIGFRTYNYEQEILEQLTPGEVHLNELDPHPSAKVNIMYAQKLFEILEADILSGDLCVPASP